MCRAQASHIGSLPVVLPCVVDYDSILRELDVASGLVSAVVVRVVDAYRNAYSELDPIRALCGGFLLHLFIERTRLLHHLWKRKNFGRITRRHPSARIFREWLPLKKVHLAEIERVYAALFSKHIHCRFASPVRLRRAVRAERRAPAMVAEASIARRAHVFICVRRKEKLSALVGKVV